LFEPRFWQNKQITQLKTISKAGEICRLEGKANIKIGNNRKMVAFNMLADGNIEFKTIKGGVYVVE
jgi:hypothetical protein